jgi:hypothetical protein
MLVRSADTAWKSFNNDEWQRCHDAIVGVARGTVARNISPVGLTYLLISGARPRAPRSDAARPLPRLTNALEEANCNGRDAVAPKVTQEL